MPQSLMKLGVHLVFSTKYRQPWIDDAIRPELHNYLGGILNHLECPVIRVGGTTDHVHAFFRLGRTIAMCDLVEEFKKSSSKWMKTKGYSDFYWQNGYGAFETWETGEATLIQYIENQQEHHRVQGFQDEYREFLKKHGIPYDERYVWD